MTVRCLPITYNILNRFFLLIPNTTIAMSITVIIQMLLIHFLFELILLYIEGHIINIIVKTDHHT